MSRSRVIAMLVAGVAGVVIASWFSTWLHATPGQIAAADYTPTYVAATQWRAGHGDDLYDPAGQTAQGAALGLHGAQFAGNRFVDAPLAAVVAAPFSLLSLDASFRLWSLLQLGLVVVAVALVVRAAPWPESTPGPIRLAAAAAAVAGVGTAMLFVQGQWDGLSALGLAFAYVSWRRNRSALGGASLAVGMLLAKPHLAIVLVAWLLGRRDRRMLAGAGAGVAAVALATLLAVGPAGVIAALRAPWLSMGVTPVRMLLGFLGLFASWLGDGPAAYALAVAAGLLALVAGFRLGAVTRRDPATLEVSLAAATALSLLAAPHLLAQDLVVLSVPMVWCLARAAAADGARRPGPRILALLLGWIALDLAARADIGNYSAAPPGRLVPVVLIAVLATSGAVVILQRRRRPAQVLVRSSAAAL
ncbi:MAG: DUF2029 domain-containing protein [Candidatus Dormibacteraeota bacterium]|nr:DUF2029 domain-containing protein [Candidatus Dormibacteraeota bacterium]